MPVSKSVIRSAISDAIRKAISPARPLVRLAKSNIQTTRVPTVRLRTGQSLRCQLQLKLR